MSSATPLPLMFVVATVKLRVHRGKGRRPLTAREPVAMATATPQFGHARSPAESRDGGRERSGIRRSETRRTIGVGFRLRAAAFHVYVPSPSSQHGSFVSWKARSGACGRFPSPCALAGCNRSTLRTREARRIYRVAQGSLLFRESANIPVTERSTDSKASIGRRFISRAID